MARRFGLGRRRQVGQPFDDLAGEFGDDLDDDFDDFDDIHDVDDDLAGDVPGARAATPARRRDYGALPGEVLSDDLGPDDSSEDRKNAELDRADLHDADLHDADLHDADFDDADFDDEDDLGDERGDWGRVGRARANRLPTLGSFKWRRTRAEESREDELWFDDSAPDGPVPGVASEERDRDPGGPRTEAAGPSRSEAFEDELFDPDDGYDGYDDDFHPDDGAYVERARRFDRRKLAALVAAVGAIALFAVGVITRAERVPRRLEERAVASLQQAGLGDLNIRVRFSGQDAIVDGDVANEEQMTEAVAIVKRVQGVRSIRNRIAVRPGANASAPWRMGAIDAGLENGTIVFSGAVPSREARDALVDRARGAAKVRDQLTVDATAQGDIVSYRRLGNFIARLPGLGSDSFTVSTADGRLALRGSAVSPEGRTVIVDAAVALVGDASKVSASEFGPAPATRVAPTSSGPASSLPANAGSATPSSATGATAAATSVVPGSVVPGSIPAAVPPTPAGTPSNTRATVATVATVASPPNTSASRPATTASPASGGGAVLAAPVPGLNGDAAAPTGAPPTAPATPATTVAPTSRVPTTAAATTAAATTAAPTTAAATTVAPTTATPTTVAPTTATPTTVAPTTVAPTTAAATTAVTSTPTSTPAPTVTSAPLPAADTVASARASFANALAGRSVEFEGGTAQLTEPGRIVVRDLARVLITFNDVRVAIDVHTDNDGDPAVLLDSSQRRADAIRAELVSQGVDTARITATGFGLTRPLAANDTPEGRARNRRIDFSLSR